MRHLSRALAQAACLVCAFAVCLGLRLIEAPRWFEPGLLFDGQPMMSTHDAYAWLAGATGVNLRGHEPLAVLVELVNGLTGLSPETIAFWIPPVLAALAGLPLIHLAHRLGILAFGFPAAVVAGCSLSYVIRSRVGSLDTDAFALLFPLFLAVELFILLSPFVRDSWRGPTAAATASGTLERASLGAWIGSFGLGLWCLAGVWLYGSARPIMAVTLGFALLCGLALARPGMRFRVVVLTVLPLGMLLVGGVLAVVGGLAVVLAMWRRPELAASKTAMWTLVLALALGAAVFGWGLARDIVIRLSYWMFSGADVVVNAMNGPNLPAVLQSIREAQAMPFMDVMHFLAGHSLLFVVFTAGYAWLVFARPAALVFLPLLILGLAAPGLGARFSMFGAAAMGAGAVGIGLFASRLVASQALRTALAAALAVAAVAPAVMYMERLKPEPVLSPHHAAALSDIATSTPSSSWLWLWWDYGYAAEFYAERFPIANGARHTPEWLYPVAAAHAFEPSRAANLMRFFAASMQAQEADVSPRHRRLVSGNPSFIHEFTPPMNALRGLDGLSAQTEVQAVADGERRIVGEFPDQYFVVSWDTLRLAGWITRFGTRNLADGSFAEGNMTRIEGDVRVDTARGLLQSSVVGAVQMASLDVLDESGNSSFSWPRASGVHVVMNRQAQEAFMMDATVYRSAMIQMLVKNPAQFERDYELKIDVSPWARVYRLLP